MIPSLISIDNEYINRKEINSIDYSEEEENFLEENEDLFIDDSKQNFIVSRCPKCSLIPKINLCESNKIEFKCPNEHYEKFPIEEYNTKMKLIKISESLCHYCNKKNEKMKYCFQCKFFVCFNCINNHKEKTHILINSKKMDNICPIDGKEICDFCNICQKSLCSYCIHSSSHQIIGLRNSLFKETEINDLKNKIKNYKVQFMRIYKTISQFLAQLKKKNKNMKDKLKNFYQINKLEIYFIKDLINTYDEHLKKKNLNFNILNNLSELMKINEISFSFKNEKKIGKKLIIVEEFLNSNKYILIPNSKNLIDNFTKDNSIFGKNETKGQLFFPKSDIKLENQNLLFEKPNQNLEKGNFLFQKSEENLEKDNSSNSSFEEFIKFSCGKK